MSRSIAENGIISSMLDKEHEEWLSAYKAQKGAKRRAKPAGKPQKSAGDEKKGNYDDRDLTNPYKIL